MQSSNANLTVEGPPSGSFFNTYVEFFLTPVRIDINVLGTDDHQ